MRFSCVNTRTNQSISPETGFKQRDFLNGPDAPFAIAAFRILGNSVISLAGQVRLFSYTNCPFMTHSHTFDYVSLHGDQQLPSHQTVAGLLALALASSVVTCLSAFSA